MNKLKDLGVMTVSGQDARDFLQRQMTQDFSSLGLNEQQENALWTAYCHPKGRVLVTCWVYFHRENQSFVLVMAKKALIPLAKRLKMFVLRSQVSIEVQENWCVERLPEEEMLNEQKDNCSHGHLGSYEFKGVLNQSVFGYRVSQSSLSLNATNHRSENDFLLVEIQAGLVWVDNLDTPLLTVHELGLDVLGAISFQKGCYPGQEIVARTHYLGKQKQKLVCLSLLSSTDLPEKNPMLFGTDLVGKLAEQENPQPNPQPFGFWLKAMKLEGGKVIALVSAHVEQLQKEDVVFLGDHLLTVEHIHVFK